MRNFRLTLAACCVLGLLLRLGMIVESGWRIDYDEAMIGLLALRVMRGEWMAFIPAQSTLGAVEPYILAPIFTLLGVSTITFRMYSLLCGGVYIITTGLLGREAFGERVGALAALLAAFAPPYMLITGMKTWGFTIETIILGNLLFLLLAQSVRSRNLPLFALAGLVAGVMFWGAWLSFYYYLPAALVLLAKGQVLLRKGWGLALLAFFIGSAPFWLYNMSTRFATFITVFARDDGASVDRLIALNHFTADLLPRLVTGDVSWNIDDGSTQTVLVLLYYGGLISFTTLKTRYNPSLRWLLVLLVAAIPLLYLFSGYASSALNPWGIDATGRYVLMLHTVLPLGIAVIADQVRKTRLRYIGAVLVALVITFNLLNTALLDLSVAFDSPYYDRQPESLTPLIEYLDARSIDRLWTDVGIAQILTFVTNERIIAADYYDAYIAEGPQRFPGMLDIVANAPYSVFVVPILAAQQDIPIQRALDAAGIRYTLEYVTPTLVVFLTDEKIDPQVIAAGLGYQY